jgi:hypothetical protein
MWVYGSKEEGGLEGEVIRRIRGIRERGGKERYGEVFDRLPKVRDRRFWTEGVLVVCEGS